MKKLFPIIIAVLLAVMPLTGCDCGSDGARLAKTPKEEYERIYSLVSAGRTFDFDEQPTFSAEAQGTLSGGNLQKSIQMTSLYTHDYTKAVRTSYSRYKRINALFESNGVIDAYYDDETEAGFQLGSFGEYAYLESRYSEGSWSFPQEYGNGNYADFLGSFPSSADALARKGARLLNPEYIESFDGAKSGGSFFVEAKVKKENIAEFADWLDAFFPMFGLRDDQDDTREWKFFDLTRSDKEYSAKIEIRTTPSMLEEVRVTFDTVSDERVDLGSYEFSARMTFKSGGVTVKRMSYFDGANA